MPAPHSSAGKLTVLAMLFLNLLDGSLCDGRLLTLFLVGAGRAGEEGRSVCVCVCMCMCVCVHVCACVCVCVCVCGRN